MPGFVTPIGDERENLLGYIDQQRDAIRYAAFGLTDEQARKTLPTSTLSIGGLIKHVTLTERGWVATVQELPGPTYHGDEFALPPDETLADVLADLAVCGEETAAAVRKLPMDAPVPVPPGTGWDRLGIDTWSVRWVLGHLIEELARHAGHADLIRESIDGRTARELRAMANGRKPP